MSYYGESQWPAGAQPAAAWDHQTPPTRSGLFPTTTPEVSTPSYIDEIEPGASSAIPREETSAFWYQFEEVERAIENLVKSGKMYSMPGARREFQPPFPPGPARNFPNFGTGGPQRPHSVDFDGRPGHPASNIQNFYASQRHQSSRGSNEAEQMMQQKRRMAAQRERELRNYHQEQQYNRTAFGDMNTGAGPGAGAGPSAGPAHSGRPDRNASPGGLPERELIARQQRALYEQGPFGDAGGYIDETGAARQGLPVHHGGPLNPRGGGPSPLAYEYGRNPPVHPDAGIQTTAESAALGAQQPSRTSSNASPQSNSGPKGPLEQANRTSNSSPAGSSPQNVKPPAGKTVAPIGTRPPVAGTQGPVNPALMKQSGTPLPSPLNHGYGAPGTSDATVSSGPGNTPSTATSGEGSTGLGNWGSRGGPWGPKTQTSVWG